MSALPNPSAGVVAEKPNVTSPSKSAKSPPDALTMTLALPLLSTERVAVVPERAKSAGTNTKESSAVPLRATLHASVSAFVSCATGRLDVSTRSIDLTDMSLLTT